MRVYFSNLGCKLNQAEVDSLARQFLAAGHSLARRLDEADLHIVNSCTVTHLAARDSRKIARRGHRLRPEMKTVLTGCHATSAPEEAAAVAGVDLVITNDFKDQLLGRVHEAFPELVPSSAQETIPVPYVPLDTGLARALVKIEDGCNMGCSFCIIPSTRGRQRSRSLDSVVEEVQALADGGYREVVITGVQISEYDDGSHRLFDLASAILESTTVPRIRLTSLAPWKFDDRLFDLWQNPRLCRHIHMSLQSGCTATLRRMRRPYSSDAYEALASRLREHIPGLALTTDVILGFPGETDDEFEQSLDFVTRLSFAKPHLFTYSSRPGTRAAELPDHVEPAVKKERMKRMLSVAAESEGSFRKARLGECAQVVWEGEKNGLWTGLSDHYVRVFAEAPSPGASAPVGELGQVRIESQMAHGVFARLANATLETPLGLREIGPESSSLKVLR